MMRAGSLTRGRALLSSLLLLGMFFGPSCTGGLALNMSTEPPPDEEPPPDDEPPPEEDPPPEICDPGAQLCAQTELWTCQDDGLASSAREG